MAIFIVLWLQDVGRVPCPDNPALKCLVEFDPDLTKWTPDIIMEYTTMYVLRKPKKSRGSEASLLSALRSSAAATAPAARSSTQ